MQLSTVPSSSNTVVIRKITLIKMTMGMIEQNHIDAKKQFNTFIKMSREYTGIIQPWLDGTLDNECFRKLTNIQYAGEI